MLIPKKILDFPNLTWFSFGPIFIPMPVNECLKKLPSNIIDNNKKDFWFSCQILKQDFWFSRKKSLLSIYKTLFYGIVIFEEKPHRWSYCSHDNQALPLASFDPWHQSVSTAVWPQQTVRLSCWSSMFNGIRPELIKNGLIQHTFKLNILFVEKFTVINFD